MLTASELKARRTRMGGSDVAAALGLSKWQTPLQLFMEKRGELPESFESFDPDRDERLYWGHVLESSIARAAADRLNAKVRRVNRTFIKDGYKAANIDRRVLGARLGLECKNVSRFGASDWGEDGGGNADIPIYYLTQCLWYIHVTAWDEWRVAALVDGSQLRLYRILPDKPVMATMVHRVDQFWQCVQTGRKPAPVNLQDMLLLYPKDTGRVAIADPDVLDAAKELVALKAAAKENEELQDALKMQIAGYMGDAAMLVAPDGTEVLTWKSGDTTRIDSKRMKIKAPALYAEWSNTTSSRTLRIKGKFAASVTSEAETETA